MDFNYDDLARLQEAWESVRIARPVHYGLFTFGESVLPYFLVCDIGEPKRPVAITRGEIRVTRPTIFTPENSPPELHNFFEDYGEQNAISLLLARTASFRHLKFNNVSGNQEFVSDSVEEVVDRLNRRLDDEEEDQVAILTAPGPLAGMALLRYAADRIVQSAPDNLQELRERGFLP